LGLILREVRFSGLRFFDRLGPMVAASPRGSPYDLARLWHATIASGCIVEHRIGTWKALGASSHQAFDRVIDVPRHPAQADFDTHPTVGAVGQSGSSSICGHGAAWRVR
jgi:hypothetical protein